MKGINPKEVNPVEVIKAMSEFMKNTNQMLAQFKVRLDNLQIDIDKLNKNYKNNGKRIINV